MKTRLAADLGDAVAAEIYAAFVADTIERFRRVADKRTLAFSPDGVETRAYFAEVCDGDFELWPQPETGLGERMTRFFNAAFASGATRAVLIGSDSPTLPLQYVEDAFGRLRDGDCVLGPATDGGYYLIGFSRPPGDVLDGIAWSGPRVLSQTTRNLQAAGYRLRLLPVWYDVDSLADLQMLAGHLAALSASGSPEFAPHTAAALKRHTANESGEL